MKNYILDFTEKAIKTLDELKSKGPEELLKATNEALERMEDNPRFKGTSKLDGECYGDKDLWHSRATKSFRVCWVYNTPTKTKEIPNPAARILIVSIGPHDHYKR